LRRCISSHAAGITSIDSSEAVIMPPIIGAAMRCITSAPVPLDHMIGNRPAKMTATVIAFGHIRSTAPSVPSSVPDCFPDSGKAERIWLLKMS